MNQYMNERMNERRDECMNEWMFRVSTEVSGGYEECTKDGILISDIFCLPKNYRKDVPPHSK